MTTHHDPHYRPSPASDERRRRGFRPRSAPASGAERPPDADGAAVALGGERLVLSVAEAGRLLGISRALAYELVARGDLPSLRLGRRLVVPRRALLELLGLASATGA